MVACNYNIQTADSVALQGVLVFLAKTSTVTQKGLAAVGSTHPPGRNCLTISLMNFSVYLCPHSTIWRWEVGSASELFPMALRYIKFTRSMIIATTTEIVRFRRSRRWWWRWWWWNYLFLIIIRLLKSIKKLYGHVLNSICFCSLKSHESAD